MSIDQIRLWRQLPSDWERRSNNNPLFDSSMICDRLWINPTVRQRDHTPFLCL
jgi:hypothetical protein